MRVLSSSLFVGVPSLYGTLSVFGGGPIVLLSLIFSKTVQKIDIDSSMETPFCSAIWERTWAPFETSLHLRVLMILS